MSIPKIDHVYTIFEFDAGFVLTKISIIFNE